MQIGLSSIAFPWFVLCPYRGTVCAVSGLQELRQPAPPCNMAQGWDTGLCDEEGITGASPRAAALFFWCRAIPKAACAACWSRTDHWWSANRPQSPLSYHWLLQGRWQRCIRAMLYSSARGARGDPKAWGPSASTPVLSGYKKQRGWESPAPPRPHQKTQAKGKDKPHKGSCCKAACINKPQLPRLGDRAAQCPRSIKGRFSSLSGNNVFHTLTQTPAPRRAPAVSGGVRLCPAG